MWADGRVDDGKFGEVEPVAQFGPITHRRTAHRVGSDPDACGPMASMSITPARSAKQPSMNE